MEARPSPPPEAAEPGYDSAAVAGAVLATLFFPFISLIVALVLQGAVSEPRKKSQLRTWAWVSGSWLLLGIVIALIALLALVASGSGTGS